MFVQGEFSAPQIVNDGSNLVCFGSENMSNESLFLEASPLLKRLSWRTRRRVVETPKYKRIMKGCSIWTLALRGGMSSKAVRTVAPRSSHSAMCLARLRIPASS